MEDNGNPSTTTITENSNNGSPIDASDILRWRLVLRDYIFCAEKKCGALTSMRGIKALPLSHPYTTMKPVNEHCGLQKVTHSNIEVRSDDTLNHDQ